MLNKILIIVLIFMISKDAFGLRISRPLTLKYPITEDQVSQINKYLEDLWNIQNGRFELDVTTSKTSAKEGEIWVNSSTNKLEWMSNGSVRSAP